MRLSLASLMLIVGSFIFFLFWAFSSLLLGSMSDALLPTAPAEAVTIINTVQTAFGVIAAVLFFAGVILVFILDATSDEPELYYRER